MTAAAPTFHVIQQVDGVQVPETDSFDYARVIVDSHLSTEGHRLPDRRTEDGLFDRRRTPRRR